MSLLDNMRQTLNDVAGTVVEQGKQLTAQTQLQVAVKKMQLERARRIHELGKQTFDWYRNGQLVVSGQVPADVADLCHQLEDLERELADAQRELDAIAAESATPHVDATVTPAPNPNPNPSYTTQGAAGQTPQPPYAQAPHVPYPQPPAPPSPYAAPPASSDPHGTTVLPNQSQPQPPYNAPYGAPPTASYGYNPPPADDEKPDAPTNSYPGMGPRPPAP